MAPFEVRGTHITAANAKKFREEFTGQDWREKLVEGFNLMLRNSKKKKLTVKERHAFYKWMVDATK